MRFIPIRIRKALPTDLDSILAVQREAYEGNSPELVEDATVFRNILEYSMSYVATNKKNKVRGYLLVHPSRRNYMHLLDEPPILERYDPNVYFIHDLAITPKYRRHRIGTALVQRLLAHLMRTHFDEKYLLQLIAINGAEGFWTKHGFHQTPNVAINPIIKLNYGGECTHMSATF